MGENDSDATSAEQRKEAIDAIVAACKKSRAIIAAQQDKLSDEIFDLSNPNPPRQLNDAENAELAKLDNAMQALLRAEEGLLLDTLIAFESSDAVKSLADALKGVNSDLKTKITNVQAVAKRLTKIVEVISQIDGIVKNLTKVAALLA